MTDDAPVIVFDGVCVLCSRWVRFVLRHDRSGRTRFATMQSTAGRELLIRFALDPDDPLSLLYVIDGRGFQDTEAILRVLAGFGGAWRASAVLRLVPRAARDVLYRWLARNRYRWFGRTEQCLVPTPEQAARFLC
jgi:predicted DCC family thiol-disulfide oxidoreductase YuxK